MLTVLGTAVGNVFSELDAYVSVAADFLGDIFAGEQVALYALSEFHGSVSTGGDVHIYGEGDFNADVHAGKDLYFYTLADVHGNYEAARDATIITYGDFNAALHTGRDVGLEPVLGYLLPGVWARGNIEGVITADRNIGHRETYHYWTWDTLAHHDVFAHGYIDAALSANNSMDAPNGGWIGSVGAWGEIGGVLQAAAGIQYVHSGDAVTADLIAPVVVNVSENDSTIEIYISLPDVPQPIAPQVLAAAAEVFGEVLTVRMEMLAARGALLDEAAVARLEARNAVSEARARIVADNEGIRERASESLASDKEAASKALEEDLEETAKAAQSLRQSVDGDRKTLKDNLQDQRKASDARYKSLAEMAAAVDKALAAMDDGFEETLAKVHSDAEKNRQHRIENWEARTAPPPPPAPITKVKLMAGAHELALYGEKGWEGQFQMMAQARLKSAEAAIEGYEFFSSFVPGWFPIMATIQIASGENFMGRELTLLQKILMGAGMFAGPFIGPAAGGILKLGSKAARPIIKLVRPMVDDLMAMTARATTKSAAKYADDAMRSLDNVAGAAGRHAGNCFVAGTGVVKHHGTDTPAVSAGELTIAGFDNLLLPAALVGAGVAGHRLVRSRRKKAKSPTEAPRQRASHTENERPADEFFALLGQGVELETLLMQDAIEAIAASNLTD